MKPFALLLLWLAAWVPEGGAADALRPNIVYLLIDDLGYANVGFNGSKVVRTPHLDRLAKEGSILESFYVQPVCSPTRAALLTGRYPTHTGVYSVVTPGAAWGLPLAERTLANALHEAGYATAICGKWHLGEFRPEYGPLRRGFDHHYGNLFGALDYFTHRRNGQLDWFRDGQPATEEGYTTHLVAKEACRLIREKPPGQPLFLYVPFNAVHAPFQVPEADKKAYPDLQGLTQTVAAMISSVDEAVGQITTALEETGQRQNTLLIFSSDNGGPNPGRESLNTPLRSGKGSIYEGGLRACAFVNWPGQIPGGVTIKEPIHAIDWYPTLLKLGGAKLEQPLAIDGLDIWPVLTKGAKSPHDALLLTGLSRQQAAVRMGDWKLLLNPRPGPARPANEPEVLELYNLAEDVAEENNRADAQPKKVQELRTRLATFLSDAVAPGDSAIEPAPRAKAGRRPAQP